MSAGAIYPSLAGRPVFVSGGGSGIGAALVAAFARQQAAVHFVDLDEDAGHALVETLAAESDIAVPRFTPCDLRDTDRLSTIITEATSEHGGFRALVNNAANDTRHDWQTVSRADWDDRMAVNLRHQFFAIQAVAPGMAAAGGGSIINFGSVSWQLAMGGMPGYTTAKAAVHGLTRGMARDLGASHIRVNTVVPGAVLTERQRALWVSDEDETRIRAEQCLPESLLPEDLAPTVLFLAADDSRTCTGHEYFVDAGWS